MSIQSAITHPFTNWKTTSGAVFTILLTLSGILTASPSWAADYGLTQHQALWITLGIAGIKLAIGAIQKDGGTSVHVDLPPGTKLEQDTKITTQ